MCGIFGYSGKGVSLGFLIQGLNKLEYRGYDSCGVVASSSQKTIFKKTSGKIEKLKKILTPGLKHSYSTALLHTRWATHGKPNQINAHPHKSRQKGIYIVHNGIIENSSSLRKNLEKKGYTFKSETDSEAIANLIDFFYKNSLEEAVFQAVKKIKGSFALGVFSEKEPNKIVGVCQKSPLLIGVSCQGYFLASDLVAVTDLSQKVIYLKQGQIAVINRGLEIYDFKAKKQAIKKETIKEKPQEAKKDGYKHFMLKEIHQQPKVLRETFDFYVRGGQFAFEKLKLSRAYLKKINGIFITGCGTAYHAAYVAKYFLEKNLKIKVDVDTSSEFRYRNFNVTSKDLFIAISQSGETADTLAAVRKAKKRKAKVLAVCNVATSTLARESDSFVYTPAGPEIGVASTKAYTAQLMCLYLFSLYLTRVKGKKNKKQQTEMLEELSRIPAYLKKVLSQKEKIAKIAKQFSKAGCFLFLGREINFPTAMEGALKLKEISYIPAEGYPAGEMKHGPIALIDEYRAVVCIAPLGRLHDKMISSLQEIRARKGKVLAIINSGDREIASLACQHIEIPKLKFQDFSPLLAVVALQIFAYFVAKNLGREIDQPRNLAKAVTVE